MRKKEQGQAGERARSRGGRGGQPSIDTDLVASPADRLALTLALLDRASWSRDELDLARALARTPLPET